MQQQQFAALHRANLRLWRQIKAGQFRRCKAASRRNLSLQSTHLQSCASTWFAELCKRALLHCSDKSLRLHVSDCDGDRRWSGKLVNGNAAWQIGTCCQFLIPPPLPNPLPLRAWYYSVSHQPQLRAVINEGSQGTTSRAPRALLSS